jgi:hypothetical protein
MREQGAGKVKAEMLELPEEEEEDSVLDPNTIPFQSCLISKGLFC